MAILEMRTLPDPVLRQKAKKVTAIDSTIQKLIDDMIETMMVGHGVGLAAPQVGVLLRIVIIKLPEAEVLTLINPEIVKKEGERDVAEACLSVPGYAGRIKRAVTIKMKAKNRQGKEFRLKAQGLLAQVLEHEIDHLDGVLYSDLIEGPENLQKVAPQQQAVQQQAGPRLSHAEQIRRSLR